MNRRWWLLAMLVLLGCREDATPLMAYRNPLDAVASRFPLDFLNIYPCGRLKTESGVEVVESVPVDQCYRMSAPERMQGVWVDEFEGSRFDPGLKAAPAQARIDFDAPDARQQIEREKQASIWLALPIAALPPALRETPRRRPSRTLLLDFVGRQTLYPGNYGHMGMSAHEIVVDRIISARALD